MSQWYKHVTIHYVRSHFLVHHGRRKRGGRGSAPPLWSVGRRSPSSAPRTLHIYFDFKSRPHFKIASYAYVQYSRQGSPTKGGGKGGGAEGIPIYVAGRGEGVGLNSLKYKISKPIQCKFGPIQKSPLSLMESSAWIVLSRLL